MKRKRRKKRPKIGNYQINNHTTIRSPHLKVYNTIYPFSGFEKEFDKLEQLIYLKLGLKRNKKKKIEDETIQEVLAVLPEIDFKNL